MKLLAEKLSVDISILYGVYLESLDREKQSKEFPKYASMLKSSNVAIRSVEFDAIQRRSLNEAIEEMKKELYKMSV